MAIQQTSISKVHWNYFLALERDMEVMARYVEFSGANLPVYSIELAHLLFAAASEVDAVAKLICAQAAPGMRRENIDHYKVVLLEAIPDLPTAAVHIPRYGLSFMPWSNWGDERNPDWWRAYNRVKHERDIHFNQATLQNAINALGGLLVLVVHYYSRKLATDSDPLPLRETTRQLEPESALFRLDEQYYYNHLIV